MAGKGSTRQRALSYVLGLKIKPYRFVDAGEDVGQYFVRYENPFFHGMYHKILYQKPNERIEKEILKAAKHLEWIAEGNELPTK